MFDLPLNIFWFIPVVMDIRQYVRHNLVGLGNRGQFETPFVFANSLAENSVKVVGYIISDSDQNWEFQTQTG